MNRRRYLALLGSAVTGGTVGCLSHSDESSPEGTAGGTPGPTPTPLTDATDTTETPETTVTPPETTPAPGECEAVSPPRPSTSDGLPDPESYPAKPDAVETTSVRTFLEAYETAYRFNSVLADLAADGACVRHLDASATAVSVAAVDGGVVGSVTTRASYTGDTCRTVTGTDTPTPLPHADLARKTARYYVTDRFLIRKATVVECWD